MHQLTIAILLSIASISASAADIEVAIGMTKFDKTNGIFYYENLYNDIDIRSASTQIVVSDRIYGQRFRLGYQYFGHVTQRSTIYTNMRDGNCHPGHECGPAQRWEGEGTTQALFLQWEPEYRQGDWRFFADVGPMLVKSRFQEKVIGGFPPGFTVDSPNDYRWKWLGITLGVEYKGIAITYQRQPLSSSSECTFITKADTLSVRVRF